MRFLAEIKIGFFTVLAIKYGKLQKSFRPISALHKEFCLKISFIVLVIRVNWYSKSMDV